MAAVKEPVDKHDREIAAIRKLLPQGMRMLPDLERRSEQEHAGIRKELKEFAGAQKRTDAALQSFIDSMRRGGNGHKRGWAPA